MWSSSFGALLKRWPNCGHPSIVHGRFWHSAQWWRCLLCSQNAEGVHTRHVWRRLLCWQKAEPWHNRHFWHHLSCGQKAEGLHVRHCRRRLLCWQKLVPPHRLQSWRCFPCGHFLRMRRFTGGAGGTPAIVEVSIRPLWRTVHVCYRLRTLALPWR